MSLISGGQRVGRQEPSFLHKPSGVVASVDDAVDYVDLAASFGLVADPWQEGIITGICARDSAGKFVAPRDRKSVV